MKNLNSITTEDLKATCQNFPKDIAAVDCAIELERRIGSNPYTLKVCKVWDCSFQGLSNF